MKDKQRKRPTTALPLKPPIHTQLACQFNCANQDCANWTSPTHVFSVNAGNSSVPAKHSCVQFTMAPPMSTEELDMLAITAVAVTYKVNDIKKRRKSF